MSILRAMLFNHDTNCSIRETISEFFHNACTPVPTGRAGGGGYSSYNVLYGEVLQRGPTHYSRSLSLRSP